MSRRVILPSAFLPPVSYFVYLAKMEEFRIEKYENFQKRSIRNRCRIMATHGVQMLTVPVQKANSTQPVTSIHIDYTTDWQTKLWRSITTAYGNAPYFIHYGPIFEGIIRRRWETLWEMNEVLLSKCLEFLKMEPKIHFTEKWVSSYMDGYLDLRKQDKEEKLGRKIKNAPYIQVFGNEFVANLSVIDLLFCEGPYACKVIEQSLIIG